MLRGRGGKLSGKREEGNKVKKNPIHETKTHSPKNPRVSGKKTIQGQSGRGNILKFELGVKKRKGEGGTTQIVREISLIKLQARPQGKKGSARLNLNSR